MSYFEERAEDIPNEVWAFPFRPFQASYWPHHDYIPFCRFTDRNLVIHPDDFAQLDIRPAK